MDILDRLHIDVPVLQAGMGGGVAGAELVSAVAVAGALGTLGLTSPRKIAEASHRVRSVAPGRAVAVNLLMPFVRRRHVRACLENRIDVAVLFYGGDREIVASLRRAGVFVMSQVGTPDEARQSLDWGVDGLIAQGSEAGGHLLGVEPAREFAVKAIELAGTRPVFVAGGIADAADVRRVLEAGASGAVAGTRFLLTHESAAHPDYKRRVLAASRTIETTLFGLGWPARHRVIENAATRRWLTSTGQVRALPARISTLSAPVGRVITDAMVEALPRIQRARLPLMSPVPPLVGAATATVEATPLYAGESALRIDSVVPAAQAVAGLTP